MVTKALRWGEEVEVGEDVEVRRPVYIHFLKLEFGFLCPKSTNESTKIRRENKLNRRFDAKNQRV
jgi:hypothetical protein